MSRQIMNYERLNEKYLKDAEALLQTEDYVQAGEKIWGAAAEAVKVVDLKRDGKRLMTHRSLAKYVESLDQKYPRLELLDEFMIFNGFHANFYEDWLPKGMIETGYKTVKEFVQKLNKLST